MNILNSVNQFSVFLATTLAPFGGNTNATAAASDATDAAVASAGTGSIFDTLWPILMWVGVAVLVYFFMYRQPKKEMKKKQEMRGSIKVGDSVVTNAGLFGKVVEIGTDAFIIEFGTNKGVRVPILKEAVEGVREPKLEPMQNIDSK